MTTLAAELPAIELDALRKAYRGRPALDGVSLWVGRGEAFGLLGPNGAGKSTLVKILLGLVRPDGGTARLLGQPAGHAPTRRRVGYLPEQFLFPEWPTPLELLAFHGRLAGMAQPDLGRRSREALALAGIAERAGERLGGFSKGMLQRVGLAQAILARPEVVFLDEPTSALDPVGRRDVRELVLALRAAGTAVVLSSHLLGEVELTCDRVAIIAGGRVLAQGPPAELANGRLGRLEATLRAEPISDELVQRLGRHARVLARDRERLRLEVEAEDRLPLVARTVFESGARLFELTPSRTSLEDVFVELVKQDGQASS